METSILNFPGELEMESNKNLFPTGLMNNYAKGDICNMVCSESIKIGSYIIHYIYYIEYRWISDHNSGSMSHPN